jgi:asparagine synthase (glutamine-hydrolysing)
MSVPTLERAGPEARYAPWLVRFHRAGRGEPGLTLEPHDAAADGLASNATVGQVRVLFRGRLHSRSDLAARLGVDEAADDAALVLRAYEQWGQDVLRQLRGVFAVFIWDGKRDRLLSARDPHGMEPLFWAQVGDDFVFAPSPTILLEEAGVSGEPNRAVLAELILRRWPVPDETVYDAIRRVHVLHALEVANGTARAFRYWNHLFDLQEQGWAGPEDLETFDELLERSVLRCLEARPSAVLLSGGFDSVSVSAVAVDLARRRDVPTPMALSLLFPAPETYEGEVQVAVARKLGMRQVTVDPMEAAKPEGIVARGLELSMTWPWPFEFLWAPAYRQLLESGARDGVEVVLTGDGGDEWLTVDQTAAADLIAARQFRDLFEFAAAKRRSYDWPRLSILQRLLWESGLRPILKFHAFQLLERYAPESVAALKGRRRDRRLAEDTPGWLFADPDLRQRVRERCLGALAAADHEATSTHFGDSFRYYLAEGIHFDHALSSFEREDAYERGRRAGVEHAHPYLDPDLVSFLFRVPPALLMRGGREKGLVRETVARRFPSLGFERQKKMIATGFHYDTLRRECPDAWRRLGGAEALVDLGVVRGDQLQQRISESLASPNIREVQQAWDLIRIEWWLRRLVNGETAV